MFYIHDKSTGKISTHETINDLEKEMNIILAESGNDTEWMEENIIIIQGQEIEFNCSVQIKLNNLEEE